MPSRLGRSGEEGGEKFQVSARELSVSDAAAALQTESLPYSYRENCVHV